MQINPGPNVRMSHAATEVTGTSSGGLHAAALTSLAGISDAMVHATGVPTFAMVYPELTKQYEPTHVHGSSNAYCFIFVFAGCSLKLFAGWRAASLWRTTLHLTSD
jgi:hypothetical protein